MPVPRSPIRPRTFQPPRRGSNLGVYIALGFLPSVGLFWAAVLYSRGELPLDKLPSGTGDRLWVLGGLLVGLILAARLTLPPVHAVVSACERGMRLRGAVLRGKIPGSRMRALVEFPFLALGWAVTYPIRFLLLLAILALLILIAILTVQLFKPTFMADWLPSFIRSGPR